MAVLTREAILNRKPKTLKIDLPDDEGSMIVRKMTALDWERIKERDPNDVNIGLQCAMILCDEEGRRLFDPDNPEDVKACADAIPLDHAALLLQAAGKLTTGPTKEDVSKNSKADPNSVSASA